MTEEQWKELEQLQYEGARAVSNVEIARRQAADAQNVRPRSLAEISGLQNLSNGLYAQELHAMLAGRPAKPSWWERLKAWAKRLTATRKRE